MAADWSRTNETTTEREQEKKNPHFNQNAKLFLSVRAYIFKQLFGIKMFTPRVKLFTPILGCYQLLPFSLMQ